MKNANKTRVFARTVARELTTAELEQVSGGTEGYTVCEGFQSYNVCYTAFTPDNVRIDDSRIADLDA